MHGFLSAAEACRRLNLSPAAFGTLAAACEIKFVERDGVAWLRQADIELLADRRDAIRQFELESGIAAHDDTALAAAAGRNEGATHKSKVVARPDSVASHFMNKPTDA